MGIWAHEVRIDILDECVCVQHNFVTTSIPFSRLVKFPDKAMYIRGVLEGSHDTYKNKYIHHSKTPKNAGDFLVPAWDIANQVWKKVRPHPNFLVYKVMEL